MRFKLTYDKDTNKVYVEDTFKPFRTVKVVGNTNQEIYNAICEYYEQDYRDTKVALGEEINLAEMMIYSVNQFDKNVKNTIIKF